MYPIQIPSLIEPPGWLHLDIRSSVCKACDCPMLRHSVMVGMIFLISFLPGWLVDALHYYPDDSQRGTARNPSGCEKSGPAQTGPGLPVVTGCIYRVKRSGFPPCLLPARPGNSSGNLPESTGYMLRPVWQTSCYRPLTVSMDNVQLFSIWFIAEITLFRRA